MQPDDIARIADWLATTDIGLLELRGPGTALRLRQTAGGLRAEAITDDAGDGDGDAPAETVVTAPSLGVFLHRHPLRADDLAPAGSAVTADQVLGLLQTGPLLRPVRAPADGVLLEALVPHGATVGYGTPLFALSTPA
jgi:acetyl-CoA carboxylase biotin carboxyl carrier protein